MKLGEQIIIVEIKGQSKSAAEKNAAQLEKWVSTYLANEGIEPKGILLVNTYRDTPIDKRTQVSFPHQMIPYSERRNHCLLTTLQLCTLLLYCRANPDKKEKVLNDLIKTVGVYEDFNNWNEYISSAKKLVD